MSMAEAGGSSSGGIVGAMKQHFKAAAEAYSKIGNQQASQAYSKLGGTDTSTSGKTSNSQQSSELRPTGRIIGEPMSANEPVPGLQAELYSTHSIDPVDDPLILKSSSATGDDITMLPGATVESYPVYVKLNSEQDAAFVNELGKTYGEKHERPVDWDTRYTRVIYPEKEPTRPTAEQTRRWAIEESLSQVPVGTTGMQINVKDFSLYDTRTGQTLYGPSIFGEMLGKPFIEGATQISYGGMIAGGLFDNTPKRVHINSQIAEVERTPMDKLMLRGEGVFRMIGGGVYGAITGSSVGAIVGTGAAVVGSRAIGTSALSAAKEYAFTVGKTFGIFTAFDAGIEYATTQKTPTKAFSSEHLQRNLMISAAMPVFAPHISGAIAETGAKGLKLHAVEAGATAAYVSPYFSIAEGRGEYIAQDLSAILAVSSAFGVAGWAAEKTASRFVIGRTQYRTVDAVKGTTADLDTGFKLGVEKINTKTGASEFYGAKFENKNMITTQKQQFIAPEAQGKLGKGSFVEQELTFFKQPTVAEGKPSNILPMETKLNIPTSDIRVQPKGIAEAKGTGAAYEDRTKAFFKELYDPEVKINSDTLRQNIDIVAGSRESGAKLTEAIKKSDATVVGSNIERSIRDRMAVNPRFQPGGHAEGDLTFAGVKELNVFKEQTKNFIKIKKTENNPLVAQQWEGRFVESYTGQIKGGGSLDIKVMSKSFLVPKTPSPGADLTKTMTFDIQPGGYRTYSAGQQIASKFMTVGYDYKGNVKPIEYTKTKYMYDVASMGSKSKSQTEQTAKVMYGGDIPTKPSLPTRISRVSYSPSPPSISQSQSFSGSRSISLSSSLQPSSSSKTVSSSKPSSSLLPSSSISSIPSPSEIISSQSFSSSKLSSSSEVKPKEPLPTFKFTWNIPAPVPALPFGLGVKGGGSEPGRGVVIKGKTSKQLKSLAEAVRLKEIKQNKPFQKLNSLVQAVRLKR